VPSSQDRGKIFSVAIGAASAMLVACTCSASNAQSSATQALVNFCNYTAQPVTAVYKLPVNGSGLVSFTQALKSAGEGPASCTLVTVPGFAGAMHVAGFSVDASGARKSFVEAVVQLSPGRPAHVSYIRSGQCPPAAGLCMALAP
jgi:hypothetical protein